MPYGDYDCRKIMHKVRKSRTDGAVKKINETTKELEVVKKEHDFNKRQLQVHEKREKKRTDGLKKAQQSRKKNGKK